MEPKKNNQKYLFFIEQNKIETKEESKQQIIEFKPGIIEVLWSRSTTAESFVY